MLKWFVGPKVQLRFWTTWTLIWLCLMPVTLVTVLRVSLEWVTFMSLFANVASCGTAAVAALAYVKAESADSKADHVLDNSPHIPEYGQKNA